MPKRRDTGHMSEQELIQSQLDKRTFQRTGGSPQDPVAGARRRREGAARAMKRQAVVTGGLKALSTVAMHRDRLLAKLGMHRK
jgi:hypothetical protein